MNLPTIGVIEGNSVTASVTLDTPVSVSAIRFVTGYNPEILTNNGNSLNNLVLQIHEISARCENMKVSAPTLASLKVNGKDVLDEAAWHAPSQTYLLKYENDPDGVRVEFVW
jgi:hypothetical protein